MLFRLPAIRFAPSAVPTLAAFIALCLTLYLGHWQQQRAVEKRALQSEFDSRVAALPIALGDATPDPAALRFARASARGEWLESGQIFLDNKFDHEAVGFHVLTPLKIAGTNRHVLVNRGWVARAANYPAPPSVPVPSGPINAEGILTLPGNRFIELTQHTIQGHVWQNLTIERYRVATSLDILPLVLIAETATSPLKPVSAVPDARAEKHVEYMLTWYSLAATVVVLWLVLNVKLEGTLAVSDTKGDER